MKYLPEKILGWIGVCTNMTLLVLSLASLLLFTADPTLIVYPGENPEEFIAEGIVSVIMTIVTTIASVVALFMFNESVLASGILLVLAGVFSGFYNMSTVIVWIIAGTIVLVRFFIMTNREKKSTLQ